MTETIAKSLVQFMKEFQDTCRMSTSDLVLFLQTPGMGKRVAEALLLSSSPFMQQAPPAAVHTAPSATTATTAAQVSSAEQTTIAPTAVASEKIDTVKTDGKKCVRIGFWGPRLSPASIRGAVNTLAQQFVIMGICERRSDGKAVTFCDIRDPLDTDEIKALLEWTKKITVPDQLHVDLSTADM